MTYCDVVLALPADPTDTKTLTYKLFDTPVTRKFVQVVNDVRSEPYRVDYVMFQMYGQADIPAIHEELQSHIDFFNTHFQPLPAIYKQVDSLMPYTQAEKKLYLNRLNSVHEKYEYNEPVLGKHVLLYNADRFQHVATRLGKINNLVHCLQHLLSNEPSAGITAALLSNQRQTPSIPLDDRDLDEFTLDYSCGDLLLAYSETGKRALDIALDDDLALLENGGRPTPNTKVCSGVYLYFGAKKTYLQQVVQAWADKHSVSERYGLDLQSRQQTNGHVRLGRLVSSNTSGIVAAHRAYSQVKDIIVYDDTSLLTST